MVKAREIYCRSILSKSKLPGCDYVINPYVGCGHACTWCYGRFVERWLAQKEMRSPRPWGSFVDVKINAPVVLRNEVEGLWSRYNSGVYYTKAGSTKPVTIFLSSVCDPYQPIEAKYKLTRRILEILSGFSFPIAILTQSKLVIRDIDLFKKFEEIEVGLSFITMDEKATQIFQPMAALPKERVATLKRLHDEGIKTYIHVGPILPHFTDFNEIFKATSQDIGAALGETLNTRGGNWTNLVKLLSKHYPRLLPQFKKWKFKDPDYLGQVRVDFEKAAKRFKIKVSGVYHHV